MSDAKHLRARRRAVFRWLASVAACLPLTVGWGVDMANPASASASVAVTDAAVTTHRDGVPQAAMDLGTGVNDQLTVELALDASAADGSEPLRGVLVIRNRTKEPVKSSSVRMGIEAGAFDSRQSLTKWLTPPTEKTPREPGELLNGSAVAASVDIPEIGPDERVEVPFTLPTDSLDRVDLTTAAVYPLRAQLVHDRTVLAEGHSTVVAAPLATGDELDTPYQLNVVVPVLAAINEGSLISAQSLEKLTENGGRLQRLLDAVDGTQATLALDPRILVSIRALGDDAPASARAWLERLESLNNPSIPLAFADANLRLQQEGGLDAPLQAESFAFAIDGHTFTDTTQPQASPTASSSTAPEPKKYESGEVPTIEQLQSFAFSNPEVVWPASGTVSDVGSFDRWVDPDEDNTVLIDGAQASGGEDATLASGALQQVDGTPAIVTDNAMETAVEDLLTASNPSARNAALNRLVSTAALSMPSASDAPTQVIALPRQEVEDPDRVAEVLKQLESLPSIKLSGLPALPDRGSSGLPPGQISPGNVTKAQLTAFSRLQQRNERGESLTGLYDVPEFAMQQLRVELLRATSVQRLLPDDTKGAVDAFTDFAVGAWHGIKAEQGSEIQLIGRESAIPLFVANHTNRQINVEIRLRATTGHLQVDHPVVVTVAPDSVTRAQIPVNAIANGSTVVHASLWTPDGVELPTTASFAVNINTDLETVIIAVLGGIVVVLLIAGFIRTRKRIMARRAATDSTVESANALESTDVDSGDQPDSREESP